MFLSNWLFSIQMNNHYKTLGIDRHALADEIRAAYRKLAQRLHPDKNGGVDEFQALEEAYRVLSDPEARARYDRGEDPGNPESKEQKAMSRLAKMFQQAAGVARDDKDMIALIREGIAASIKNGQQQINANRQAIEKAEHTLGRVTYNGEGVNLLEGVINEQIRANNKMIGELMAEIELVGLVTGMLDDYECEVKQPVHQAYSGGAFGGLSSTTTAGGWSST